MRCTNITKKGSALHPDPTGHIKPLWCTSVPDFKVLTNRVFRAMQRRLASVAIAEPGLLEERQVEYGYKYNKDSWLQDESLSIAVPYICALDWMHCIVEDGAWEIELTSLLEVLVTYGLGAACLHTYL